MKSALAASMGFLTILLSHFPAHCEDLQGLTPIVCQSDRNETVPETRDCLSRLKGLATRSGEILRLNLANGKTKVYKNNERACDDGDYEKCVVFRILRYYPGPQSFLISYSSGECGHLELVSRRTGGVVELASTPQFSPSGNYLISVDDSDGCERQYDFAIWSTKSDPPLREFQYRAQHFGYWKLIGWNSDERIRLVLSRTQGQVWIDQPGEAFRSAAGWKVIMGKSAVRKK
jgi:hypothetical protein